MKLQRRTLCPAGAEQTTASLHERFHPGFWVIEEGCSPPPAHRPGALLADLPHDHAMAASLRTITLLPLNLGAEFVAQMQEVGCHLGAFADLAVHEILVNAAIHGNLHVAAGNAGDWHDLAAREGLVAAALADAVRARRVITMAVGWNDTHVAAAIADEGEGYAPGPCHAGAAASPSPARAVCNDLMRPRAAGRGLMLARAAAQLEVLRGGRCTRLLFARQSAAGNG